MKKKLLLLSFASVLFAFAPIGEKKYKLELTEREVGVLLYALDESKASHAEVIKPLQTLIQNQLKSQIDTTRK